MEDLVVRAPLRQRLSAAGVLVGGLAWVCWAVWEVGERAQSGLPVWWVGAGYHLALAGMLTALGLYLCNEAFSTYEAGAAGIRRRGPLGKAELRWEQVTSCSVRTFGGDYTLVLKDGEGHRLPVDLQMLAESGAELGEMVLRQPAQEAIRPAARAGAQRLRRTATTAAGLSVVGLLTAAFVGILGAWPVAPGMLAMSVWGLLQAFAARSTAERHLGMMEKMGGGEAI